MNYKQIFLPLILIIIGLCSGCDSFLDVKPKDQYTQDQLLATRGGYYIALNGAYNNIASSSLYGSNLSYGLIDIIAKRYAPLATNKYFTALNSWNYGEKEVATTLSSLWGTSYQTILNCNVLLEGLKESIGILSENEQKQMRGELLALRAFLHLDMLRLFGPIYKQNPQAPAIPYNESIKITNLPILTAEEILNKKIIRDLNEAEQLLTNIDPIIEKGPMASSGEEDEEIYHRYRQLRLNYYAIIALKARAYLYGGQKEDALREANRLIQDSNIATWFPFVDPNKLLANSVNPDRIFSTEVFFGFYLKSRGDIFNYTFSPDNAGTSLLQPRKDFVSALYEGETADYRFQSSWGTSTSVGATGDVFLKYKDIVDEKKTLFYGTFMPLIRLSEVYLIAAECETSLDNKYKTLNIIREKRGIPALPVTSEEEFVTRLRKEYIREFQGEGQLFFMFKRMFLNIEKSENGHDLNTYGARIERFVPPMPASEIENR